MNARTPDGRQISLATLLRISADSPEHLRACDVDRVMDAADGQGVSLQMREWLLRTTRGETRAAVEAWAPAE